MNSGPVGVAVVGAGMISRKYLANLVTCPDVRVLGIADIDVERAHDAAAQHGLPHAGGLDTILALDEVEIIVNLTIPAAHSEVAHAALDAGKHVYNEKPLVLDTGEGQKLLAKAAQVGRRVGCAPDSIIGAGIQSAIRALADGVIGAPVSATAVMQYWGPDQRHPRPEPFFQRGAGPVFDMGPYYLGTLVAMFGSARRVAATARMARTQRVVGSGSKAGTSFAVEVPTHVNALLEFAGGPNASATFSFDSPVRRTAIEILGTEGILSVPKPNMFDGSLTIMRAGDDTWRELPVQGTALGRGIGVVEMARAIRSGRPHRASLESGLHMVELMSAISRAADEGVVVSCQTEAGVLEPLPVEWDPQERTIF